MTIREEIRSWLLEGGKLGASHVIVACDTFDWEDYPVYVRVIPKTKIESHEERVHEVHDIRAFASAYCTGDNMQKVMEVYNLGLPIEEQLAKERVYNY